jgi:hypothetical protein
LRLQIAIKCAAVRALLFLVAGRLSSASGDPYLFPVALRENATGALAIAALVSGVYFVASKIEEQNARFQEQNVRFEEVRGKLRVAEEQVLKERELREKDVRLALETARAEWHESFIKYKFTEDFKPLRTPTQKPTAPSEE